MDLLTFCVILFSLLGNAVFVVVGVCLWKFIIPPTAMLLIRKRVGQLKDSMLALVCYDDGVAVMKALKIRHEGVLESYSMTSGVSETYYIAKPTEETGDRVVDKRSAEIDRHVLPSVSMDGFPVALCYALDGVAVNADTLLALNAANHVKASAPRSLVGSIKLPGAVVNNNSSGVRGKLGSFKIKVLLPLNPLDIHRTFRQYWDQSMIHATKQRHENIGAAKSKKDGEKLFKFLIIMGVVVLVVCVIGGVVLGRFI